MSLGDWLFEKAMTVIGNSRWYNLDIGDEIKIIKFLDEETEEGEMKFWMRVDRKNEDKTVTGPITSIHCGDEYITDGDIATEDGRWYLKHKKPE